MTVHPLVELLKPCPSRSRIRAHVGDCFCIDPEYGNPQKGAGKVTPLAKCLACPRNGSTEPPPPMPPRVGDAFAELLAEKYGATVTAQCDCQSRINEMNVWGPDGCEREIEAICGWVIESAAKVDAEIARALADNPELRDPDPTGRRLRALAPDRAKRWKLRPLVRQAIKIVRDWKPPQDATQDLAAA